MLVKRAYLFTPPFVSVLCAAVLSVSSGAGHVSPGFPTPAIFAEQEDLVYEVSWTFVKLGTIHIKTLGHEKAIAYIDSYDGLPFVDLHSVHYTEMDSNSYSLGGYAVDKQDTVWKGLRYLPDRSANKVIVEELYQRSPSSPPFKHAIKDTLHLTSPFFVDGLSIGFFPRLFIHTVGTMHVPTVLKGNVGTTTFYFTKHKTSENIDALDDPVRVVEVEGTTDAVGIFGMTGDFTGWFSDDEAAVPIKGKLKVLLGNVTVELSRWSRKGWTPPQ